LDEGGIRITWAHDARVHEWHVLRRVAGQHVFLCIAALPSHATEFLDAHTHPGVTYQYRLAAFTRAAAPDTRLAAPPSQSSLEPGSAV
jgi:hypothetical protein